MQKTVFVCLILWTLTACVTSPTGRSQLLLVDDGQMASMGERVFDELKEKSPPLQDSKANARVCCIVRALTQELQGEMREDWDVRLFNDKTPNAFALPGKKIGVNIGMLKLTENNDQLAAVIGHEIGHVLARHGNERASLNLLAQLSEQVAGQAVDPSLASVVGMGAKYGVLLPYSRSHETEADIIGQELMARAGFNPQASVAIWELLQQQGGAKSPEFLSTHPSDAARIQLLGANLPQADMLYQQAKFEGKKPSC